MFLSFLSMATGTESSFLHHGFKKAVAITAFPFLKAKSLAGQGAGYAWDFVMNYAALRKENAALRQELVNFQLTRARRAELFEENKRLRGLLHFARQEPGLTLDPVQVLETYKGMLRIDKGSMHGITPSMAVVTPDGVVGVVTEVSVFTAVVATLHHPECRVGAMVLRDRVRAYDGVIHANTSDLNVLCTLDYIDMKNEVRVGDIVVVSPGSLFPAGYPIGNISAPPHETGSLWKSAEVTPMVDPYRLDEVFVIRQALPDEAELAGPLPPSASQAPNAPDNRSLQERYAP